MHRCPYRGHFSHIAKGKHTSLASGPTFLFCNAHAGKSGQRVRLSLKGGNEFDDMLRHQPVVLIQKKQPITSCGLHQLVGNTTIVNRCSANQGPHRKGATSFWQHRNTCMRDQHFNVGVSLQRDRVKGLWQKPAIGAANQYRHQHSGVGLHAGMCYFCQTTRRHHGQHAAVPDNIEFLCSQNPVGFCRCHCRRQGVAAVTIQCLDVSHIVLLLQL